MQIGLSPKVFVPTALLIAAGLALLVIGLAFDAADVRAIALATLASAGIGGVAGYAANPGITTPRPIDEPGSDQLLGAGAEPPQAGP